MLTRLRQSEFVANVAKLFAGNGLVFTISLFAIPVISRLYTPDDYGVIGLFISILAVVTVFATLKYEVAIVLPDSDDTARGILRAALLVALGVSLIVLASAAVTTLCCSDMQMVSSLGRYVWFLPLGIVLMASVKMLVNGWLMRKKQFGRMAVAEMSNSIVNIVIRIILGFVIGSTIWGLLVGLFAGLVVGLLVAWPVSRAGLQKPESAETATGIAALKQYPEFPAFTMPADFIRTLAQKLPVLMFGFMYSPATAGLFYMADRLIKAPVELGLRAFRGVFLQKVSAMHNAKTPLRSVYVKTVVIMFLLGLGPAAVLFFRGQEILTFILGEKWIEAGRFAEILAPLLLSFWVTSPAAMLLITLRRQNYWLLVQASIAILQICVFVYAYVNGLSAAWALSAFVVVQLTINLLMKALVYGLLDRSSARINAA